MREDTLVLPNIEGWTREWPEEFMERRTREARSAECQGERAGIDQDMEERSGPFGPVIP